MIAKVDYASASGGAHNADTVCNVPNAACMFIDADNNYQQLVTTLSANGKYISVSRTASNLLVTALTDCHVHGYHLLGGTSNYVVIDSDYTAGQTILNGNYYAILEAY